MNRLLAFGIALVLSIAPAARGDDSDEVKRLKDKIELLETKLKLAEREIADLKKGKATEPAAATDTLSDLLPEGTLVTGTNVNTATKKSVPCSITITKRDGKKFEATTVAGPEGAATNGTIEGEITGNTMTVRSIGNADAFTGKLTLLKGKSLEGLISYKSGTKQALGFIVVK